MNDCRKEMVHPSEENREHSNPRKYWGRIRNMSIKSEFVVGRRY
jgi:hypothetical protein